MITFEQVEKLRQKTNISYEEAKKALEETGGDLLEAVINLEKKGHIKPPTDGGSYSSREDTAGKEENAARQEEVAREEKTSFGDSVASFFKWLGRVVHKGNVNSFEVVKDSQSIIMLPLTALVLLFIFAFWVVIPLLIVGLIFGYRFRFRGPDLDNTRANQAMDKVSDATLSAVDSVLGPTDSSSGKSGSGKGENEYGADPDNRR